MTCNIFIYICIIFTSKILHVMTNGISTLFLFAVSYPYEGQEPFIIDTCPDVIFAGNQDSFGTAVKGMCSLVAAFFWTFTDIHSSQSFNLAFFYIRYTCGVMCLLITRSFEHIIYHLSSLSV